MGFLSRLSNSVFKKKTKTDKSQALKCAKNVTEEAATVSVFSTSDDTEMVLTKEDPIPKNAPEALRVVREWIQYKDEHNMEKMKELIHEKCFFTFSDSETEMPSREFIEACSDCFDSFPDLHFFWKSMKIQGINSNTSRYPGTVVVIKDYYGIGKHTGTPYSFGPYPPVEPTGTTVRDENIEFTFTVRDGKIVNATIYAFGEVVGPPGFYTKVGGMII